MKPFVKGLITAILFILLIPNTAAVCIYADCFIDKIIDPNQIGWVEMDSAAGWALYTGMFIVVEVILIIAIIRLFAQKSVQTETNNKGDR